VYPFNQYCESGLELRYMSYVEQMTAWQAGMEATVRAEDGWLSFIGLYGLEEGENTVGSAAAADVCLPERAPKNVGVIEFRDGVVTLRVTTDTEVLVDGQPVQTAVLRNQTDGDGASVVQVGDVRFGITRRGDDFMARVRDPFNPKRLNFTGRVWYPVDEAYRVRGVYTAHESRRFIDVENTEGGSTRLINTGSVAFELMQKSYVLEVFYNAEAKTEHVWLIFKDATSGKTTYGAGRFLYSVLDADGMVEFDFNKAYHPPCAFTEFTACPVPPRENILSIAIPVGERFADGAATH
jgi:uncharacterized protein (DUF1684 family)